MPELPEKVLEDFERESKNFNLTKAQREKALEKLKQEYEDAIISPGEAIGIITAESWGEPSTQMSIDYKEKIIVKINNRINILEIGNFIEKLINKIGSYNINKYTDVLPLDDYEILVPSINKDEKIEWKRVIEVSKHKSPNKLIKITTASGRKITATDNHSFVTRFNNSIIPVTGKSLQIGNRIPAIKYLPEHCASTVNITDYTSFPDINSFRVTRKYRPTKLIAEELVLDCNFGWFIGAYLAEGHSTNHHLSISNLNERYINNAKKFIKTIGLDFIEKRNYRGFAQGCDFAVNSSLFARFIANSCGENSYCKKVPDFAYSAKEEFIAGLLKGYFDGDGNFSVNRRMIRASSNSEELLDGIKLLLTRFNIFASKSKDHKQHYIIIPYKYAPAFLNKMSSDITYKKNALKNLVKLANRNKSYRDDIDMISGFNDTLINASRKLKLPTRYVNSATKRQKIGRSALLRHIKRFESESKKKNINISSELNLLHRMSNSDVVWDKITKIEYIEKDSEYVYDLSVPGLETFTTFDGIITHNTLNTFHFAGVAELNITLGLPRLIEIFDARKKASTPAMEIYIEKEYNKDEKEVRRIAALVKETKLNSLVSEFTLNIAKLQIELTLNKNNMKELKVTPQSLVKTLQESFKALSIKEFKSGDIVIKPKTEQVELRELYTIKEKLKETHIKGVKGILQVLPINQNNEFVILTSGTNLKEILKIKEVDKNRTVTNDIFEVAEVLGIEAAREAIIHEASKVINDQGIDIDIRHLMLIADVMTGKGLVKGVTRTGITGEKESVLARASFETPIKHIINATLTGEEDSLNSVIENVILNQPVPLGTGLPSLISKMKK